MRPTARTTQHVGEWRVVVSGRDREAVFREVARVIANAIAGARGESGSWEHVRVDGRDWAALLVAWANELIGRSEASGRAYERVRNVRCATEDGGYLIEADILGRAVDDWRSPIKAATYHGVTLEPRDSRWRATLLFDI